jgi:hypothetical protein
MRLRLPGKQRVKSWEGISGYEAYIKKQDVKHKFKQQRTYPNGNYMYTVVKVPMSLFFSTFIFKPVENF